MIPDFQYGWFGDEGKEVFVVESRPTGKLLRDILVIIVPPIGPEYMHCYACLRELAKKLAGAGFHCLRFDFRGYGNSSGELGEAENLKKWVDDVVKLASYSKENGSRKKVCLLSLRSGSLVVSKVLEKIKVDLNIFWYPYQNGASFVRDLQLLDVDLELEQSQEGGIEGAGYPLSAADVRDLKGINMLKSESKESFKALLLLNGEQKCNTRLRDHFVSLGADTEQLEVKGLSALTQRAQLSVVPRENIFKIIAWLIKYAKKSVGNSESFPFHNLESIKYRERIFSVPTKLRSNKPALFAVLSIPATIEKDEEIKNVVLIGNAGSAHSVGPNRLNVGIARVLAENGITSLRYDLRGLGESNLFNYPKHPYPGTALADIKTLYTQLEDQGVQSVSLLGLCSGAYHAFHAALVYANTRKSLKINTITLINPLFFYWQQGREIEGQLVVKNSFNLFLYYCRRIFKPTAWLKYLESSNKLVQVVSRVWLKFLGVLIHILGVFIKTTTRAEREKKLKKDLLRIRDASINIQFYFGRNEKRLRTMINELGPLVNATSGIELHLLDSEDHTFSSRNSRKALYAKVVESMRDPG